MAFNSHNFGIAYGALVRKPYISENKKNGSHTVLMTVFVHRFNSQRVDYLDFQRYIPERSQNLLEKMQQAEKGDLVYIEYHPEKVDYIDKANNRHFKLQLNIDQITFMPSTKDAPDNDEGQTEVSGDDIADMPF